MGYTQSGLSVVNEWTVDIPFAVWGLCFGKVGGIISDLTLEGATVSPDPPVSVPRIYAAIVYVSGS
jgi:hypothetical protein